VTACLLFRSGTTHRQFLQPLQTSVGDAHTSRHFMFVANRLDFMLFHFICMFEASIALELKLEAPRGGHHVYCFVLLFRVWSLLGWGNFDSIARGVSAIFHSLF